MRSTRGTGRRRARARHRAENSTDRLAGMGLQEKVEIVSHDGEPVAVDGEETDELFEMGLDPVLAMGMVLAAEKRPADASRDPVVPRTDGLIDDHRTGGHQGWAPARVQGFIALCRRCSGPVRARSSDLAQIKCLAISPSTILGKSERSALAPTTAGRSPHPGWSGDTRRAGVPGRPPPTCPYAACKRG